MRMDLDGNVLEIPEGLMLNPAGYGVHSAVLIGRPDIIRRRAERLHEVTAALAHVAASGRAVVVASHDPHLVDAGHAVVLLREGRLWASRPNQTMPS